MQVGKLQVGRCGAQGYERVLGDKQRGDITTASNQHRTSREHTVRTQDDISEQNASRETFDQPDALAGLKSPEPVVLVPDHDASAYTTKQKRTTTGLLVVPTGRFSSLQKGMQSSVVCSTQPLGTLIGHCR